MIGVGSSCGACKFLRRKCTYECVFAPYFSYDEAAMHFAAVHKVFGASNVSKLLLHLPVYNRSDAAITVSYEALARMYDPVYGCVAHIYALQQQVAYLQEEIEILENQMASQAVGNSGCGNFQASKDHYVGIQFSSRHEITTNYQNQLDPLSCDIEGGSVPDHPFNGLIDMQFFPPSFSWEDQYNFCDSSTNSVENLLGRVDQENFSSSPWLKKNMIAENQLGSS